MYICITHQINDLFLDNYQKFIPRNRMQFEKQLIYIKFKITHENRTKITATTHTQYTIISTN